MVGYFFSTIIGLILSLSVIPYVILFQVNILVYLTLLGIGLLVLIPLKSKFRYVFKLRLKRFQSYDSSIKTSFDMELHLLKSFLKEYSKEIDDNVPQLIINLEHDLKQHFDTSRFFFIIQAALVGFLINSFSNVITYFDTDIVLKYTIIFLIAFCLNVIFYFLILPFSDSFKNIKSNVILLFKNIRLEVI